jgi:hypothetical protein
MCDCVPASQRARVVLDPAWLATDGRVVHPDAPAGGGGPGFFRIAAHGLVQGDAEQLAHPDSPRAGALDVQDLNRAERLADTEVKRQAPPEVKKAQVQTIRGMRVTVQPDESGIAGVGSARTDVTQHSGGAAYVHSNDTGKILSWSVVPYQVDIVTRYGSGTPPADAAYGRGTTKPDVDSGNVTLGFHESCHRSDILAYLTAHPLPAAPSETKISTDEGDTLIASYNTAVEAYFQAARDHSTQVTDEVGKPTKTAYEQKAAASDD